MALPNAAWRLSYTTGTWLALSGPTSLVVMPAPPAEMSTFATNLWEGTLETETPDALFAYITEVGIGAMPDFAAMFWDEHGLHGMVRGEVQLLDAQGQVVLEGKNTVTWREELLEQEQTYTLRLSPVDEQQPILPLVVGAALVSSVTLTTAPSQLIRFPSSFPDTAVNVSESVVETSPEPVAEEAPELGVEDMPASESVSPESPASPSLQASPAPEPPESPTLPDSPEASPLPQPEQSPASPASPPSPGTRQAPVVVAGSFGEVDEDGGTVFSTDLAAKQKPSTLPPDPDPQVLAVPCAQGHPNPRGATACRLCSAPVNQGNPRLIRRPVLAAVMSNQGMAADIVQGVIVGRSPDPSKGPQGAYLMRVETAAKEISRSQILITSNDWNVVVTDLHSTNGTRICPVGEPEFELRDGRSVTVEIGTELALDDHVRLRIVPPRSC